jgi:hypothetical protein
VLCPSVADALVAKNAQANASTQKIKLQKALLSNKQLLYVKVKQATFNPLNFAIFKDTTDFQQQFLTQLAAIPSLDKTGLFKPETLYFSLHKHLHSSARKLKGFLYTACFSYQQANLNLQELILKCQRAQEKQCFSFNLPAFSSANPKEGAKMVKSKVLFSLDLQSLFDTFMLEFQVKIPPIISANPIQDFAILVTEFLYPADQKRSELTAPFLNAEISRFASYCNPLIHTSSEKGVIVANVITGHFPLNLDDSDSPDFAICQRLIFASYFGLDMRPGHHQQYKLILPILSDPIQLKSKPAAFKDLAEGMREALNSNPGITAPRRSRIRNRNDQSNSSSSASTSEHSETESAELFLARSLARNAVLNVLDPVPTPEVALDYPHFSTITYTRHQASTYPLPQESAQSSSEKLCKFFILGKCREGKQCKFLHEILSIAAMNSFQQKAAELISTGNQPVKLPATEAERFTLEIFLQVFEAAILRIEAKEATHQILQDAIQRAFTHTEQRHAPAAPPSEQDRLRFSADQVAAPTALRTLNDRVVAAQLSIERLRAEFPGYGDDDYDITNENFDPASLPSAEKCSKATRIPIEGDGDCPWHAFLAAYKLLPMPSIIQMSPKTSPNELRRSTLHFLKANRNNKILPTLALPHAVVTLTSPEAHLKSQQVFKFTTDSKGRKVKCNCNGLHLSTCNGQRFGEIQIIGSTPLHYTSFDEYFDIMIRPGAYSEDLEIMALAARFNVNFVIWQPVRGPNNNIACYYRANNKTVITLKCSDGWGHYETLSFANVPLAADNADCAIVLGTPLTPPHAQSRDSPSSTRNNAPSPLPVHAWISLKLHNIRVDFAAPDKSPLSIIQTLIGLLSPAHKQLAKIVDANLHIPATLLSPDSPCVAICICNEKQDLMAQSPVFYAPVCLFQFRLMAETSLKCVSSAFFLESNPEDFYAFALHFLLRMNQALLMILQAYMSKSSTLNDESLDSLRISMLMIKDAISIIASPERVLLERLAQNFSKSASTSLCFVKEFIEITELAMAGLCLSSEIPIAEIGQVGTIVASLSQSLSQGLQRDTQDRSQRSSQGSDARPLLIDLAIAIHFEQICSSLADDAEKAASLAQDRLLTVSLENAMIAKLQLQTLQNDLAAFHDFCSNIGKGYESIAPHYVRAQAAWEKIQEYARRIAAANLIANEAAASPLLQPGFSSPLQKRNNTPTRGKPQTPRPILNERQLAQQTTLAAFFKNISSTASNLKKAIDGSIINDGVALFTQHLEKNIIALEKEGICELTACNERLERRSANQSKASRFMDEAHNVQRTGQADSDISDPDMSEHDSDREFAVSQGSAIDDSTNPRFLQARKDIRKAANDTIAPEIAAVSRAKNLPIGFCRSGHPFTASAILRHGKVSTCSFCSLKFSADIYTCSCWQRACKDCLSQNKTAPPPPKCPNLECHGSCLLRFKPLIQHCYSGNHSIPAKEHFWMCSVRDCQSIICAGCRDRDLPAPPNPQSSTLTADPLIASAQLNNPVTSRPAVPKGKPPNVAQ